MGFSSGTRIHPDFGGGWDYVAFVVADGIRLKEEVWPPGEARERNVWDDGGTSWHCTDVDWPAQGAWLSLHRKPTQFHARRAWMGSLIAHGQDASGQYYRRNRYYDASTGRFTQEDPIGLAGGVNLYGYANGDPVSYADPYGLSACNWLMRAEQCVAERLRLGMARHGHHISQLEAEYYVVDTGTALVAAFVVRRSSGFANQMASKYPSRAGVANAARHQYGQCLMTKLVGDEIAATTADLHEAGATDQEDSQRDQANNRIGRAIGRGGPTVNCAAAVEANIQSGNYDWESGSAGQYLKPNQ